MIGPQNWMVVHKFTAFFLQCEMVHVQYLLKPDMFLYRQSSQQCTCRDRIGGTNASSPKALKCKSLTSRRAISGESIIAGFFFYSSVIPEYSRPIPIFTHLCFRVSWCIPKVSGPAKVPNPWVSLLSFPFQMATMVHYPISSRKTLWLWPFNPPFKWVKQKEAGVHGNHPRIG